MTAVDTSKCEYYSKFVAREIMTRSHNIVVGMNQEMMELDRVEKVYSSKVTFLEKCLRDINSVKEDYKNLEQQIKSSEREQCKLIGTVIQPALKATQKMLNQLEEMESGEIEAIVDFESVLDKRTQVFLDMLKEYKQEKYLVAEQEKIEEVRRLQLKSEELNSAMRQLSTTYGLLPQTVSCGLEPYFAPKSALGLKAASIKNMAEVIRSTNEITAKIDASLEPDLNERLEALEKELISLQPSNIGHFSDLI